MPNDPNFKSEPLAPTDRSPGRRRHHGVMLAALAIAATAVGAVTYGGIVSRIDAEEALTRRTSEAAAPSVTTIHPAPGAQHSEIALPGYTQAFIDTPIYNANAIDLVSRTLLRSSDVVIARGACSGSLGVAAPCWRRCNSKSSSACRRSDGCCQDCRLSLPALPRGQVSLSQIRDDSAISSALRFPTAPGRNCRRARAFRSGGATRFRVFSTKRGARARRNLLTGDNVVVAEKHVPAFRTGKEVHEVLNRR